MINIFLLLLFYYVGLLSNIFEQDFILSCDSNGGSDIYLGVEPLTPLVVGEVMLMTTLKRHFLFIHGD